MCEYREGRRNLKITLAAGRGTQKKQPYNYRVDNAYPDLRVFIIVIKRLLLRPFYYYILVKIVMPMVSLWKLKE